MKEKQNYFILEFHNKNEKYIFSSSLKSKQKMTKQKALKIAKLLCNDNDENNIKIISIKNLSRYNKTGIVYAPYIPKII